MPIGFLLPLLDMYVHVTTMLTVAAFVESLVKSDMGGVVVAGTDTEGKHTCTLTPLVGTCLLWIQGASGLQWARIDGAARSCALQAKLRYPTEDMQKTVRQLSLVWSEHIGSSTIDRVLDTLEAKVTLLKTKTPAWAHIITSTKYNSTLARRQLLNNKELHVITQLVDEVDSLSASLMDFNNSKMVYGDARYIEADGVVRMAKTTMAIIAAVSALENYGKTAEGSAMAAELLADDTVSLPTILRNKLKELAAKE